MTVYLSSMLSASIQSKNDQWQNVYVPEKVMLLKNGRLVTVDEKYVSMKTDLLTNLPNFKTGQPSRDVPVIRVSVKGNKDAYLNAGKRDPYSYWVAIKSYSNPFIGILNNYMRATICFSDGSFAYETKDKTIVNQKSEIVGKMVGPDISGWEGLHVSLNAHPYISYTDSSRYGILYDSYYKGNLHGTNGAHGKVVGFVKFK